MTSESVRLAGAMPDLNHRDPEFLDLIVETKQRLLNLYPQTSSAWAPFLLGGSGTLAVEAMVASCVGEGPVLVIESGYYSGRVSSILNAHKIAFDRVTHSWFDAWDFDRIERKLKEGFSAVIATHNETTTGRLNDVGRLGRLCRQYKADCLIDAMSSFGADDIDFTHLDAVAASANKCLHGIPGVSFVLAQDQMVQKIVANPRRSYYMNLAMYAGDIPPLTPPVPALSAFRQALREMPSGGVPVRRDIYREKSEYLRSEILKRDLPPAIPFEDTSCTLTTISMPPGWSFDRWMDANLEEGFVIYGCKGDLKPDYFQVSVMGETTVEDFRRWFEAVDRILAKGR